MPNNTINISFDLIALQGAQRVKNKAGQDCVLIVLPESRMNAHTNGKVYCSLDVKANRDGEDKFGKTHFIAEAASKEERMAKTRLPIIGNGKEFVFGGSSGGNRPAPARQQSAQTQDDGLEQDSIPF